MPSTQLTGVIYTASVAFKRRVLLFRLNMRLYARKPELQDLMLVFHVIDLTDTIGGRSRPNMPKAIR